MARNCCVIGPILVTTLLIVRAVAIGSWLVDPIIALSSVFLLGGRVTGPFGQRWALILSRSTLDEVPAGWKLSNVAIVSYGLSYWLWMARAASGLLRSGHPAHTGVCLLHKPLPRNLLQIRRLRAAQGFLRGAQEKGSTSH